MALPLVDRTSSKLQLPVVDMEVRLVAELLLGTFANLSAALPPGEGSFFSGPGFQGEHEMPEHSMTGFVLLSVGSLVLSVRLRRPTVASLAAMRSIRIGLAGDA